jgi:hypothetical protein
MILLPLAASTAERDVDAQCPQEGLRAAQAPGERARIFGPAGSVPRCPTSPAVGASTKRSAAVPVQELRSAMISRTHAATGSASIMPSIAAWRLA